MYEHLDIVWRLVIRERWKVLTSVKKRKKIKMCASEIKPT